MKHIILGVELFATLSLFAAVDFEWNANYDTSVPYEVELSLSRLGWENITIKADDKPLDVLAFEARESGFVGLRFLVPSGTRKLIGEKANGSLNKQDSSKFDNIFEGVVSEEKLNGWKNVGGTIKKSFVDGAIRLEAAAGRPVATYEVIVPKSLRGKPASVELDIESKTHITWGGSIKFLQYDDNGNKLPQSVTDVRWMSHMRPCDVKAKYREEGHFDPRVAKVRLEIEMRNIPRSVDEYGMPASNPQSTTPVLLISRIALRGAAKLPFPRYDDANFTIGVSGDSDDKALVIGGERAFWYQCNPRAVWTESEPVRAEEELFFPSQSGTIEAWFKPTDWAEPNMTYVLYDAYNGYHAHERKAGFNSMFRLEYAPSKREFAMLIRDIGGHTYSVKGKAEIPVGVWSHVAMQWAPNDIAELFVNGSSIAQVKLEKYVAVNLKDAKICINDYLPMELYIGSPYSSARMNPQRSIAQPFFNGAVDAFRVSTGKRYRGGFTPAKTFKIDADTRALFGFDRSFNGASGGGTAFVRGSFRSMIDRISHVVEVDGKKVQYRPKDILPENDPSKVLDIVNYPKMPTVEEFESAREVKQISFAAKSGDSKKVTCVSEPFTDYIQIRNTSNTQLMYPLVFNEGDLDPRSFGDLRDTHLRSKMSDRDRVNRIFNFVIKASDYFMDRQISFKPGSDRFGLAMGDAMLMLNSYCGFECGPLNNMTANMFACSGGCLAAQTGGYGHSFEEVFYDGKNHIYDLSAQKFFPSMDNETAAYLEEVGDQPGIHNRISSSADHFMRFGFRGHTPQNPDYGAKIGVILNPNETFRVWFGNDGWQNLLRTMPASNGGAKGSDAENLPWKTVYTDQCHADIGKNVKADAPENVWRVLRKFPDFASGYIELDVKPEPTNPAFSEINAGSFVYKVKSGYQIVRGEYDAILKNGHKANLEISTDFGKSWRELKSPATYQVMARLEYLVRVKAPIDSVECFYARTQVEVNARIFPGRMRKGTNEFNFKAAKGGDAEVTIQWREKSKRAIVKGGAYSGTIPGWERQLFVLNPNRELVLDTEGFGDNVSVVCSDGITGKYVHNRLRFSAVEHIKAGFYYATVRDGKAERYLTFYVSNQARLVLADKAELGKNVKLCSATKDSVQPCVWMSKKGDSARMNFDTLPAGKYMIFALTRFPSRTKHAYSGSNRILGFKVPGTEKVVRAAGPVSVPMTYYKGEYGPENGRGNFKWDTAEDSRQKYHVSWLMSRFELPTFSHVDWELTAPRPDGVEFAGMLIVPAGDEEDYLDMLSNLAGLNFEAWRVK